MMQDTITAIATANGVGSISIIRVSGTEAINIAKKLSHRDKFKPREASLCTLYKDDKSIIDQAIVIYFKAPFSFTGEDIVEFQCHGGIAVSQTLIKEIVKDRSIRYANAGEFSKRAFLNGKIDLSQAEAIAKLIEAKSEDASRLLARQLKGELKFFVDDIKDKLIEILAHIEVMIDYAEDDLPKNILSLIESNIDSAIKKLSTTLDASRRRDGLLNGFKLSIIGKPNVGKSSLLNKFLNYDRAIVSDIEGTTRDTIEESVKVGTHLIKIVDTAGIRDSIDDIEKIGITKSIESIDESDIVLAIFDNSRQLDKNDLNILNILKSIENKKVLVALNKIDLNRNINIKEFEGFNLIEISCKDSIEPLLNNLETILNSSLDNQGDTTLISNRQIEAVENSLNILKDSKELLINNEIEIFSFELNEAIKSISSITKPYEYSEMLDKMFGSFCLGK